MCLILIDLLLYDIIYIYNYINIIYYNFHFYLYFLKTEMCFLCFLLELSLQFFLIAPGARYSVIAQRREITSKGYLMLPYYTKCYHQPRNLYKKYEIKRRKEGALIDRETGVT